MISQIETKLIPVSAIEIGHRDRQPSEAEVEQMVNSIRQDGLLTAIGVQTNGDRYRLLYGATRLLAVQKLGRSEVSAVLYEGTEEELASAEIIENVERRHLDKEERDWLTNALVELRTRQNQSEPQSELDDNLSHNSSQEPKTHPKSKVEGRKPGRPVTAEGQAKKDVAAKTGQSLRNVQRTTSRKPKQATEPASSRTVAPKDEPVSKFTDFVLELRRRTKGQEVERFAKTGAPTDDLKELGKFLIELGQLKANLKRSDAAKPNGGFVPQGNGDDPPQESGDARKSLNATLDAERDLPVGEA